MKKSIRSRTRPNSGARENTLGSQAHKLDDLLDELDARGGDNANRSHQRWTFRDRSVEVLLIRPDGSEVTLQLAARNLSVGGASLLHSAFVYPETAAVVHLPKVNGKIARIEGVVKRCSHVRGVIHEVGIKFHEPINLHDFQESDPFAQSFSYENIDLSKLQGTIVHIDPSQIDRQIVRHLLRDSSLSIRGCESFEEAKQFMEKGCDLIITEFNLPDSDGAMLTSLLRSEGHTMPIIIISSSTDQATRDMVKRAMVDVFIEKPIEPGRLISAIAEYLAPESTHSEQRAGGLDEGMRELAALFASSLAEHADNLEKAIEAGDVHQIQAIAMQIKGSALMLGFDKIGKSADEITSSVATLASSESVFRVTRKLIMACRTVRPVVT